MASEAPTDAVATPVVSEGDSKVCTLESALRMQGQRIAQGLRVAAAPPSASHTILKLAVALLLAAVLAIPRIAEALNARSNLGSQILGEENPRLRRNLTGEDPTTAEFFDPEQDGLSGHPSHPVEEPSNYLKPQEKSDEFKRVTNPLQEFFERAPKQITMLHSLLSEINLGSLDADREQIIGELSNHLCVLKDLSGISELRPVWLMASSLEGLLKQFTLNPSEVTPSTLRTTAGAVDLLETLCVRNLDPALASKTPIQLLAVDDDPVCRQAIALALKQAFTVPDLATHGEAALALAAMQTYDVIFLDIEMPGMDGFELCSRIRQTDLNRTTPVVFVTRHTDFSFHAQSAFVGGEDLIAKPYLSFEITVKALTLALRGRLQNRRAEPGLAVEEVSVRDASVASA
jgi:CheY-like chemotaxis protein